MTERCVVSRIQAGDQSAFTELYVRYVDRIYAYLRVGLGDAHQAEDATQQVFLQAYRALPRYDTSRAEPLHAWLFAVARNHLISAIRERRRVEPVDPVWLDLNRDRAAPLDRPGEIDDAVLLAALEGLPASQRHVIALHYVLELTIREIACALDRSPHAVRQLHGRALRTLEQRLRGARAQQQATASGLPGTGASSSTVKTSHGVPSGSCTQILSCLA